MVQVACFGCVFCQGSVNQYIPIKRCTHTHRKTNTAAGEPTKARRAGSRCSLCDDLAVYLTLPHTPTETKPTSLAETFSSSFMCQMAENVLAQYAHACMCTQTCMSILWSAVVRTQAFRQLLFIIQWIEILLVIRETLVFSHSFFSLCFMPENGYLFCLESEGKQHRHLLIESRADWSLIHKYSVYNKWTEKQKGRNMGFQLYLL